jgi:phosphoribosylaminoimidazole carboxylase/phosphoribosylaminoimidazole-succinocarboxamide synthase
MASIVVGEQIAEGKTKVISTVKDTPGLVVIRSKDRITAGDGARAHDMAGKAVISTTTNGAVYELLNAAGVHTHYIRKLSDTEFLARHCVMIPLECVTRRIATGSFLKRNPGVLEGYRFCPPKLEFFYKDDANHDPQWSEDQILSAKLNFGGINIGSTELDIVSKMTITIFEILERAWASQDCTLVDMKVEFGVDLETKEILLADVIDADSWRLWPSGDRRLMKDKQVYRELKEVTPEALSIVKDNFTWIAERVQLLGKSRGGRVVVLMGSCADSELGMKISEQCATFGITCDLRVTSAHKGPDTMLKIVAEYEGDGQPTVFIAIAGRSNGLGPTAAGNTTCPVINCPPVTADWAAQDIWSSLRLPSGLGCTTVLSPEGAAMNAAQIFALADHVIWAKVRAARLNIWIQLRKCDMKFCERLADIRRDN